MSQWDAERPGLGDADGLGTVLQSVGAHLSTVADQADRVEQAAATVRESWTGAAAEAWAEQATELAQRVRALDDPIRAGAQAVDDYAEAITWIAARTAQALLDVEHADRMSRQAADDLRLLRADATADDADVRLALYRTQRWEEEQRQADLVLTGLVHEREAADSTVVARLRDALPAEWDRSGRLAGTLDPGVFAGSQTDLSALGLWALGLPEGAEGDTALRWLAGQLSDADLEALLDRCPQIAVRLMHEDDSGAFAAEYPELAAALEVEDPDARIAAVAAAFAALTPAETAALARSHPGVVHNLDGAPLTVRIAANRVAIRAAIVDAGEQSARLDEAIARRGTLEHPAAQRERFALLAEQEALRDRITWCRSLLAGDLDPGSDNPKKPPTGHQVVLFDPDSGQLGELVGSVDAASLAVLVGGTGTNLTNMDGQRDRSWELVAESKGSLAVITYLGGPMPQSLAEAVSTGCASTIGPRLAAFANGVRAGSTAPVTIAGHSYGGLVVGTAEKNGMVVDRVLLIEASGSGVRDVSEYAAPDTPRYSMTAPGDAIEAVQAIEAHGQDPDEVSGVVRLETGRVDDDDPGSELVRGSSSHSGVFESGTTAWKNIYRVMIGDEVTLWTPPTDVVIGTTRNGQPVTQRVYPMEDPTFNPPTQDVP
ncbi:MAG TPA: alpha/beta hydrolase [Cellulomonas sp.]